jgi:hypothetical protein
MQAEEHKRDTMRNIEEQKMTKYTQAICNNRVVRNEGTKGMCVTGVLLLSKGSSEWLGRGGRRYQLGVCRGPFPRFLGHGQSNERKEGGVLRLRGQMRTIVTHYLGFNIALFFIPE